MRIIALLSAAAVTLSMAAVATPAIGRTGCAQYRNV